MRFTWLVPIVAVFGCAHQSQGAQEAQEGSSPPQAAAEAPPPSAPAPAVAEATPPPAPAKHEARLACPPVKVHFAFDKSDLEEVDKPALDLAARCLSDHRQQRVSIVGNADERGSEEYNLSLGQRRADAVASYLESKGAATNQVEAIISHGKDSPLCNEQTEDCWARNRRTAIRESCHM